MNILSDARHTKKNNVSAVGTIKIFGMFQTKSNQYPLDFKFPSR